MQGLLSMADYWLAEQKSLNLHGLYVDHGGFYTGLNGLDFEKKIKEPSYINQSLAVDMLCPDFGGSTLEDNLDYQDIPPSARAGYLHYLAERRNDATSPIGFVCLYFYGLERRLLIDFQSGDISRRDFSQALGEVSRLCYLHSNAADFSFPAQRLLDFLRMVYGAPRRPEQPTIPLDSKILLANSQLAFELGTFVQLGQPIPASWAYVWLIQDGHYNFRVPMQRCPELFMTLFISCYEQAYGKKSLPYEINGNVTLYYQAQNPSLGSVAIATLVPNIMESSQAIDVLVKLADKCNDALKSYSRFIGLHPSQSDSLAAITLLPAELSRDYTCLLVSNIKATLEQCQDKKDYIPLSVDDVKDGLVFNGEEAVPSTSSMEALARFLEGRGIGIVPDYRYSQYLPSPLVSLHAFSIVERQPFTPSGHYVSALLLMKSAAFVFEQAEPLSTVQSDILEQYMVQAELGDRERQYLWQSFHWSLSYGGISSLRKVLKMQSGNNLAVLQRTLISAASVSGVVTTSVIERLQQVITLFGLDPAALYSDIHTAMADPVTVSMGDSCAEGFAIPSEMESAFGYENNERPTLNLELIQQKRKESESVAHLLQDIFESSSGGSAPTSSSCSSPQFTDTPSFSGAPTPSDAGAFAIKGLDKAHMLFLNTIVQLQGEMPLAVAETKARELNLMLNGAIDTINEIAFELVDAPVLEEDGNLLVLDQEIFEEMNT